MHILTLSPEPANSMWADFEKAGVKLHSLKTSRLQSLINIGSKLKSMVNQIKPNIIHTHSFRGTFFAGKFFSDFKRVVTIHGVIQDNHSVIYGNLLGKFFANREINSFKKAQARTVVSAFLKEIYSGFGEIKVIPNAVPSDLFHKASSEEVKKLRKRLDIPFDAKVYIVAGDLIQRKDPVTVVSAFVQAQVSNSILLVLGKGPLLDACKQVSNSQVRFLGQVADVSNYYQMADFLISASLSEGQGLSVLEGAMCGLTCLVTNLPPHQEIFAQSAHQVRFFKMGDKHALAKLIFEEHKSTAPVGEYFSIADMVNQYQNCYLSLVHA
jgi:glycosyltransferase involved in cell wall biosynthesis